MRSIDGAHCSQGRLPDVQVLDIGATLHAAAVDVDGDAQDRHEVGLPHRCALRVLVHRALKVGPDPEQQGPARLALTDLGPARAAAPSTHPDLFPEPSQAV